MISSLQLKCDIKCLSNTSAAVDILQYAPFKASLNWYCYPYQWIWYFAFEIRHIKRFIDQTKKRRIRLFWKKKD